MYRTVPKNHISRGSPFLSAKFLIACIIYNLLALGTALAAFLSAHWIWVLLPPLLALMFTAYAWLNTRKPLLTLALIDKTLQRARVGEMHHRITATRGLGEIGRVSWDLNDFLDLIETYFKEVNAAFNAVSQGEFQRRPIARGMPGEFARSLTSINHSIEAMQANETFVEQNRLASQLHELNTENLRNNLQLSQQDLKNISGTMTGIAQSAEQNADNALVSQQSASELAGLLQKISASVTLVGRTVAALNERSQAVSGTLQSITDISDQTSLLALNASIEAARAGEQGRGFAVVADEVKQLSNKTKQAAQSIGSILQEFGEQVSSSLAGAQESQLLAERILHEIEGFQRRFAEVAEDAHHTLGQVEYIKDLSHASLLKVDHVISKQQRYTQFSSDNKAAAAAGNEHYLQQWLEQQARSRVTGKLPALQQIQQHFQQLQQQLDQAQTLYQQAQVAGRQEIVALMTEAEDSSHQLLAAIDQLVAQKKRTP